ncbi:unnamed protein product [Rotaria magnacalcarata]|uniref:Translation elongation factor EFTu-like domain-containing protein n=1 Tax=Rotaria magnacalcarata TaxID=392030 RepID=A0A8S2JLG0_9BILA|nr:unnamed protein product [Rotaria magnacalcarata]
MTAADGIQTFVETTISKTSDEIDEQQSDIIRQYLSKKTAWISPNEEQFCALIKFLQKRLDEGHGETILEIGTEVTNSELPGLLHEEMEASIATLKSMQTLLDFEIELLREKSFSNKTRFLNEYLIRKHIDEEDFMEVRVAVTGNVDAGKSTLLGVLTHSILDDGRGIARQKLFRHKHEMETGRTSSVGCDILGFDTHGAIVNRPDVHGNQSSNWADICAVVSGTTLKGIIKIGDNLQLGPDPLGQFKTVQIRGIHRKRMPVDKCRGGQTASFALRKIKKSELRKGMVLLSPAIPPVSYWEFEADLLILHHPTTIGVKYQAMVHCGSIRQTATIVSLPVENLRTGDRANVIFRFIKSPEYLRLGMKLIFREGRTKAIGSISKLTPYVTPQTTGNRIKTKLQATVDQ